MNYIILLVSRFIHNSLHNSFLHIFYITFKVRNLQLQILLTEKYPGLKPRNNHITTSSTNYTTWKPTVPPGKYAFVEHSTHNSFLNISCIGLIMRELQLRILLTEKYLGLIP